MQALLKEHLAISNMYTLYKCLMFTEINLGSVPYGLNSPFESYLNLFNYIFQMVPLITIMIWENYCMDVRLARRCMCYFVGT